MIGVCHVHTEKSIDSNNSLESIYRELKRLGADFVAITDHDSIKGSLDFKAQYGDEFLCIPGGEYSTTIGHILVLFLESGLEDQLIKDEKGLYNFYEVHEAAKAQGALVVAAHPKTVLENHLPYLDGVEVFNGRVLSVSRNKRIEAIAREEKLLMFGGADAHLPGEMKNCQMHLKGDPNTVDGLKEHFIGGDVDKIVCRTGNYHLSARSQLLKMKRNKAFDTAYGIKQVVKMVYSLYFYFKKALKKNIYYYDIDIE